MFKRDLRIPDLFFHYLATFVLFDFDICLFRNSSGKMITNSLTVSMLWRIFKTGFMAFNSFIQFLTSNTECWFYSKFNFIVVSCIWEHTTLAITKIVLHSQKNPQRSFRKKMRRTLSFISERYTYFIYFDYSWSSSHPSIISVAAIESMWYFYHILTLLSQ